MKDVKQQNFLILFIKGAIIGFAGIVPGASGGILAVSMGIYEQTIDSITTFFKDVKGNLAFLLPIMLGALVGLLPMSYIIKWLLDTYQTPVMYCLIGLVLGGVPSFLKEANSRGGFKPRYLLYSLIGIALTAGLYFLERQLTAGSALPFNAWTSMLCGALIATGVVIPGISASFILIFLGIYAPMLEALNTFNIPMLLAAFGGGLATAALLVIFVKNMLKKHHGAAYYTTFGLLLGTVALIFPGVELSLAQLLNAALLAVGFFASFFLDKLGVRDV